MDRLCERAPIVTIEIAKTLTYDQGNQLSEGKQFTIDTGIAAYFAPPVFSRERGTNESTSGLLRQYFPKGAKFDKVSVRESSGYSKS